jgi:uncharacterized protein (DUF1800 family)
MGQILFDPPDVSGWDTGQTWFSSGAMLARMNFASTLAANQKFNLASAAKSQNGSPQAFLAHFIDRIATAPTDNVVTGEWQNYLTSTGTWTGSDAQLQVKAPGLVHLMAGAAEYQLQ